MFHFPIVAIRHVATSVATVVLAVGLVLGGTIAEAPAAQAPMSGTQFVNTTVKSTNVFRKQVKASQVKHNRCLTTYAQQWAKHIATKGQMVHRSKSSLRAVLKKCKLKAIGENLAKGQTSGNAVVTAWAKSPAHRKNMANKRYKSYGMASYWDGSRWWTVQLLAGK